MYDEAKLRDVRLILSASGLQERIAEQTGVSLPTIRRIAREPAESEAISVHGGPAAAPGPSRLEFWPIFPVLSSLTY